MEQNTIDWLKWRKGGIGSSDVAAVLGISPYKTALELYEEKVDPNDPVESTNYILEKGKRLEPKVRALLEMELGCTFAPALVQMDEFPFVRASLDGRSEDKLEVAEFKFVGNESYMETGRGVVPEHYMVQCQYQMLVSGAVRCYYACTVDGLSIKYVAIPSIADVQRKILSKVISFWDDHVLSRKPPAHSDKDYKTLKAAGLKAKLQRWKRLQQKINEMESECDTIAEWAKGLVDHPRMAAEGIRFTRVQRVGNVNYAAIPELQGVDLEKYRKAGSEYIQMKIS